MSAVLHPAKSIRAALLLCMQRLTPSSACVLTPSATTSRNSSDRVRKTSSTPCAPREQNAAFVSEAGQRRARHAHATIAASAAADGGSGQEPWPCPLPGACTACHARPRLTAMSRGCSVDSCGAAKGIVRPAVAAARLVWAGAPAGAPARFAAGAAPQAPLLCERAATHATGPPGSPSVKWAPCAGRAPGR